MRPQDVAAAKLAEARRKVTEYAKRAKRASALLAKWEAKARHYAARASMTDADVAAERTKREAQRQAREERSRTRGISLTGRIS